MLGGHFQEAIQDWPTAIKLWPAGAWHKTVNDQHMCRDIKLYNPGLKTVFRHVYDGKQHPSDNYDENVAKAREFFASFIDGTFFQQELYKYMDAIEEWNEYFANSMPTAECARWISWCEAVNWVWYNEYRYNPVHNGKLSHIRLVSCNTAIGNSIPVDCAKIVQKYDGILGYHNYTRVLDKMIHIDDWKYYSGRWTDMDKEYRNAGVYVKWLFTEGGATAIGHSVTDGQYHEGVYEGWKHKASYNGDFQAYLDGALKYQLDNMTAWNKQYNNRCLGGVLFTSTTNFGGGWKYFMLDTPHLAQIGALVANYEAPVEPPPIDPPPTEVRKWAKKVVLVPQNISPAQYVKVCQDEGFPTRTEIAFSADSAFAKAQNATSHSVIVYNVATWGGATALEAWVQKYYNHGVQIIYKTFQV